MTAKRTFLRRRSRENDTNFLEGTEILSEEAGFSWERDRVFIGEGETRFWRERDFLVGSIFSGTVRDFHEGGIYLDVRHFFLFFGGGAG